MSIAAPTPRVAAPDEPSSSQHDIQAPRPPLDLAQAVRLFTGLALMGWSMLWWIDTGTSPLGPAMTAVSLVGGLTVVGLSVTNRSVASWRRLDLRVLVFTLIVTGMWLSVRSSEHVYQTDEITTGQASAAVLLSGHNPYATDLTKELSRFNLPPDVATPLLDGGTIHSTSYPALSFLLYIPFGALLGLGSPFALVADGLAWILLMFLLWRLLDERLRPVVPLIASFPFYLSFIDGGVTDVLYLPFLLLALHRWDRFLDSGGSRLMRWLGPVCLGLACSVKPTPWLIAPFLVAALTIESARRGRNPWRTAATYSTIALGAFLVVNGPFIVMDPGAWAHGTLLPLLQPIVPFGQGIAMLPVYLHIAGGHVSYLGVAGVAAILASLGAFIAFYPRSARLLPLMAAVPLLLSARSLFNYFIYLAILVLVHAANVPYSRRTPFRGQHLFRWAGLGLAGAGAAAAAAATVAFLVSPAPLHLTITAQRGSGDPGSPVPTITVAADNITDKPVKPIFLVTSAGWMNPAWRTQGPAVLGPHASATYTLVSTDSRTRFDLGTVYLVDALASNPGSVSTSQWVTVP
ncbi:MAG: hypothetical protein JF886_01845 [Candidatus Dormibacteraeota bacterium]|uniref:DUF2029 domain-containing protein n=1 Tax=Candidatus Aeolococcus gillhamiae TaxID=3127015 RepID=A0A2W6ARH5_9BACT|nr:hypothetical protein [Candidatus Dormibacteraeota bacterium]PZR80391.1 MAG: hypothetical protein DLM65_08120 [Candidatus Dormibacter sp. RRmetagenome_bin12]